jgi:C-type mannose receptor
MFTEHREATTWIGLIRHENDTWKWMDGSELDFFNWHVGEPNNAGTGEDCAEMIADSAEWNDVDCNAVRRVTCRYQPCEIRLDE